MTTIRSTILLVDDDPAILLSVGDQLSLAGYEVVKAASAEEAMAILHDLRPNLIVLDMSMPGIGGMAFLRQLSTPAHAGRKYPVLVFTVREELAGFFSDLGVEGFLTKTTAPEVLIKEVSRIIGKAPATGGAGSGGPGPRRILLAEDDMDVRADLISFFSDHGHEAWGVGSGFALLEAAQHHRPNVIVLKYILPRMNGPTIAQMLAGMPTTREIPVILYDDSRMHNGTTSYPHVKVFVPSSDKRALLKAMEDVG
jgi:CheY-like chemotaxis protein